jgi:hypothetical protein
MNRRRFCVLGAAAGSVGAIGCGLPAIRARVAALRDAPAAAAGAIHTTIFDTRFAASRNFAAAAARRGGRVAKYKGAKPDVLLEWQDLPALTVKSVVRHGISVMPQFRKTEISDAELDALAQYLARNTP